MTVRTDKSFQKDVKKIRDKNLLLEIIECIDQLKSVDSLQKIHNLKKLQGFKNHYRIRIGNYRVGMIIKGNTIELIRFLDRKDIYKYFP